MNKVTAPVTDDQQLSDLANRFRQGDQEAFRQLHSSIDPDLRAFIRSRWSGSDGDDMVQQTWIKAWASRAGFENQHIRGWLFQIAKNLLIDQYRRRGRQKHESLGERQIEIVQVREEQSPHIDALRDCLQSVGGDFVAVLKLRLAEVSTEEIAERLNISQNTVYTRAQRGQKQLKDCIERKLK
ncbi:MAG: RNA polymerase sigma factor [Pirellulaceae bacterium]|nr:RNA polymerase sigma factor [Pirellulaceae bacterium]